MSLGDLFRSFLPLHNPLGFGASDFIELALAMLLVVLVLARTPIEPVFQKLARKTGVGAFFVAMTVDYENNRTKCKIVM
jgi:hypothetical protein